MTRSVSAAVAAALAFSFIGEVSAAPLPVAAGLGPLSLGAVAPVIDVRYRGKRRYARGYRRGYGGGAVALGVLGLGAAAIIAGSRPRYYQDDVYYRPAPVYRQNPVYADPYYDDQPVYAPSPVYVPQPQYYRSAPQYYRPAPVYQQPQVYRAPVPQYRAPVPVYQPRQVYAQPQRRSPYGQPGYSRGNDVPVYQQPLPGRDPK